MRANQYLDASFLPGRSFVGPAHFNAQLASWLARANQRHHQRIGCAPADRLAADLASMVALPPVAPVTGWQIAPYIEHARKAGRGQRRRPVRTTSSRNRSADVRAWAKDHGITGSQRGRIPASVIEQYEAATPGA